jgi:hypothetical protein
MSEKISIGATRPEGSAFPYDFERGAGGLTKREYFAAMALQGILASSAQFSNEEDQETGHRAVLEADFLIQELNKEEE